MFFHPYHHIYRSAWRTLAGLYSQSIKVHNKVAFKENWKMPEKFQLQTATASFFSSSFSWTANQDMEVKCFLSASTCTAPCPLFMEVSQKLLLPSAAPWQMHAANNQSGLLPGRRCKSWLNTLPERQIFLFHWPWHVYKLLRDSFSWLPSKYYVHFVIMALSMLTKRDRKLAGPEQFVLF